MVNINVNQTSEFTEITMNGHASDGDFKSRECCTIITALCIAMHDIYGGILRSGFANFKIEHCDTDATQDVSDLLSTLEFLHSQFPRLINIE